MPLGILFLMLMEAIVLPFALAIQCFHENEETVQYSGSYIQLTQSEEPPLLFRHL